MYVGDLSCDLGVAKTTAHRILIEELLLRSVCSVLVPNPTVLSEKNKQDRVDC